MSIIAKVQALIAKADRTDNEHEKLAYYAKADELILQHGIDEADLTPEKKEKIETKIVPITPKKADHALFYGVARLHNVQFITTGSPHRGGRKAYVIGYPTDVAYVEALYSSLLLHRETDLSKAQELKGAEHGKTFNHAFRMAFAGRISQRMEALHEAAKVSVVGSGIVLYDREREVEDAADAAVPNRRTTSIRYRPSSGIAAGHDSAQRANIMGNRGSVTSPKAIGA